MLISAKSQIMWTKHAKFQNLLAFMLESNIVRPNQTNFKIFEREKARLLFSAVMYGWAVLTLPFFR